MHPKKEMPAVVMQSVGLPQLQTRLAAWIGSVLLAALAWIPTVQQARGMPSLPGTMGMPLSSFLVFWTLMMVAMMAPALASRVACHLEMLRLRTHGSLLVVRLGAFVLSYFFIWIVFGLPIFGLAALGGDLAGTVPQVAMLGGAGLLVAAGFYQMTPLQAACLASCNRHLGGHLHLTHTQHLFQDVRIGLAHGMDCLGACGGCMLVGVAVGFMNLVWMFALTLIIVLEKEWRYGHHLALVVGIGLVLLGILAAGTPALIPGFSVGTLR
jgi:predicted metal-binding membrane protein